MRGHSFGPRLICTPGREDDAGGHSLSPRYRWVTSPLGAPQNPQKQLARKFWFGNEYSTVSSAHGGYGVWRCGGRRREARRRRLATLSLPPKCPSCCRAVTRAVAASIALPTSSGRVRPHDVAPTDLAIFEVGKMAWPCGRCRCCRPRQVWIGAEANSTL